MGSGASKGEESCATPPSTAAFDTADYSRRRGSSRSCSQEQVREEAKEEASVTTKSEVNPQPAVLLQKASSTVSPFKPTPTEHYTASCQCPNENKGPQHGAPLREVEESFPSNPSTQEEVVNTRHYSTPLPMWEQPTSRSDMYIYEGDENDTSSSSPALIAQEKKRSMLSRSSRSHSHEFRRSGTRVMMKNSVAVPPVHHNSQITSVPSILRRGSGVGRIRGGRNLPASASREEGWNEEEEESPFTTAFSIQGSPIEAVPQEEMHESEQREIQRVVALIKEMKKHQPKTTFAAAPG